MPSKPGSCREKKEALPFLESFCRRKVMSPFSVALRQLRAHYGIAQGEFASRLGLRQAYISRLECGTRLPKNDDLVTKIVDAFRLSPEQEVGLWQAFDASQRVEFPPPGASPDAYAFCTRLSVAFPNLSPVHFQALSSVLDGFMQPPSLRRACATTPIGAMGIPV